MMTNQSLLKIQVLTLKLAKQITILHPPTRLWKDILKELEEDYLRPIGWVKGSAIPGIPEGQNAWLLKTDNQFYWFVMPRLSEPWPKWLDNDFYWQLPQLFIG